MNEPDIKNQNKNRDQSKIRVSRARDETRSSGGSLLSGNIDADHTSQLKSIQAHLKAKGSSSTRIDAVRFSIATTFEKIQSDALKKEAE